ARARVTGVRGGRTRQRDDRLAVEEPLEIRVHGPGEAPVPVAVTMRTPGHDFELAAGFLLTEGIVTDPARVTRVAYCNGAAEQRYNVVTVTLADPLPAGAERRVYATSSCGVCGKATLDAVEVMCHPPGPGPVVAATALTRMARALRDHQPGFSRTGGLHAAGLFTAAGDLLAAREDVGRHNAVDKLVGWAALNRRLPLTDLVIVVSGRLGFEILQKAAVAGCPAVAAVSAPTSLAVDAAHRLGVTAIGFLRDGGFNVYAHPERVDLDA
ncbi:MAG: formate dehydrogenase accessory sulfurtransferase FdhD, partial [Actinomycetota bacterium]